MHVALLKLSDAPRYRALMLQAYDLAADAFTSTAEERAAEPESWWIKRIADPQSAAFGAFEDNELIGTVSLEFSAKPKTKHKAHVIGMYVSPACRGAGVGKAHLGALIEHARARAGTLLLTLTVTKGNEAAIGLYQAAGFQEFGTEPWAILTPSGFKAKVHMWMRIGHEDPAA